MMHGSNWKTLKECRSDLLQLIYNQAVFLGGTVEKKGVVWWNVPAAFDIENSNWWDGDTPRANMYLWSFALGGLFFTGRTWEEWREMQYLLIDALDLSEDTVLPVYIHNLPYEFQWIQKREQWRDVFAVRERKVIRAMTADGIQYRCSLALSGYSLASLGKQLMRYKVEKAVGDLDYDLIRHSDTPITETERMYAVRDVLVVTAYIKEYIERVGSVLSIPNTKTGAIRQRMRERCFSPAYERRTRRIMSDNTLSPEVYEMARRAFAGGFTHASWLHSGHVCYNVGSFDETSAYPAAMLSEKYPYGSGEYYIPSSNEDFARTCRDYACLFDVELTGVKPKVIHEHTIAACHCWNMSGAVIDNGRIVRADKLSTTITDVDWSVINLFYSWDTARVGSFYRFNRRYLPKPFAEVLVELYQKKTELKGVAGSETEYMLAKEDINSAYGMTATDPLRPSYVFDPIGRQWMDTVPPDVVETLDKYNKGYNRFHTYLWGVWVTAYARKNLLTIVHKIGDDYIYADTDSVKILHPERHLHIFEEYNNKMQSKLKKAFTAWGFDDMLSHPCTIHGVAKPLGAWDDEGRYRIFKTLGAKRYMTLDTHGDLSLTVSGVNKSHALPWLIKTYGKYGAFSAFNDGMVVPAENTGKLTHWYVDDEYTATITDYTGRTATVHELSYVSLAPAEYTLSIEPSYRDILMRGKHLYIENGGV